MFQRSRKNHGTDHGGWTRKKKTEIICWSAPMATGERLEIEIKHHAAALLHID
jgi:hypothetical protein